MEGACESVLQKMELLIFYTKHIVRGTSHTTPVFIESFQFVRSKETKYSSVSHKYVIWFSIISQQSYKMCSFLKTLLFHHRLLQQCLSYHSSSIVSMLLHICVCTVCVLLLLILWFILYMFCYEMCTSTFVVELLAVYHNELKSPVGHKQIYKGSACVYVCLIAASLIKWVTRIELLI